MFPCILHIKTFEVVKRQIFKLIYFKSNKTQQPLQDSRCLIYFSLYTFALHFTILNVSDTVQFFELLNASWENWMDQNYRRFLMVLRKKGDDPSSKRPRGLTFSDIDLKWSDIL